MIQVLVLSPSPALRAGLSALLSGDPDLVIAGSAAGLDDLPIPLPEDCVVVAGPGGVDLSDLDLPPGAALLLLDAAHGTAPHGSAGGGGGALPPGVVTLNSMPARILSELDLRAWGILSSDATAEALQTAVRALSEGLVVASPGQLRSLIDLSAGATGVSGAMGGAGALPRQSEPEDGPVERLTEREVDVLRLMAQGLTNKQVAYELHISEHTVKFHVSSIYAKLGAANRTEAVRKGARRGWIPL